MESFNLKESIKTLIAKLKRFLVNLIDKANNKLSQCKDSKIKNFLQEILKKLKELLTKTKSMDEEIKSNDEDNDKFKKETAKAIEETENLALAVKFSFAAMHPDHVNVFDQDAFNSFAIHYFKITKLNI